MSVFGVSMCRDEWDIIGWTLPRMAAQLDGILIADNLSTDGTRVLLDKMAADLGNIQVLDDPDPAYTQSDKMSHLARLAEQRGATWVVPFDADEVWVSESGQLRDVLHNADAGVIEATLFDHVVTGKDDDAQPDPTQRIGFRRTYPLPLPKVACEVRSGLVIEQGNHAATYPGPVQQGASDIVVHHYPYRSVEQMVRKVRNGAAAYRAAGLRTPAGAGQHWISHDRLTDEQIAEVFTEWYYSAEGAGLVWGPP